MKESKRPITMRAIFAFILPTTTILSQWFSVAGINISWLLYILLFLLVFLRYRMLFQHPGLLAAMGAVAVIPLLTFVFGLADAFPVTLYFSLLTGVVVLLHICMMRQGEYTAFLWGTVFSCVLFTAWGVYEVFTGNYLLFSNEALFKLNWVGLHYPGVAFANTNDLVQYLVLLFPVAGFVLLRHNKWVFLLMAVSVVFVIFQAGTKLGMIALVMILLLSFVVSMLSSGKASKTARLLLIGLLVLMGLWIYDLFTGTISSIVDNFLVVDTEADYFTGREDIYVPLLGFAATHPFGGFGSAYSVTETNPHNMFLYFLCDYGWLPTLVAVVIVVKMALFALRKAREQKGAAFWCLLFASLCLFIITSSISSCNEQRKAVWMFLAICLRNVYIEPQGGGEPLRAKWVKLTWDGR